MEPCAGVTEALLPEDGLVFTHPAARIRRLERRMMANDRISIESVGEETI